MNRAALRLVASLIVLMILVLPAGMAQAQTAKRKAKPAIDILRATIMVRTAIVALNHANWTGNYTVLRELASPAFQFSNSAARLAEIFKPLRNERVDLSPVVVIRPVFTAQPFINKQKMLVLQGYFPSRPKMVRFVLAYLPVAGKWRLNYISVSTVKAAPAQASKASARQKNKISKKKQAKTKRTQSRRGGRKPRQKTNAKGKGNLKK